MFKAQTKSSRSLMNEVCAEDVNAREICSVGQLSETKEYEKVSALKAAGRAPFAGRLEKKEKKRKKNSNYRCNGRALKKKKRRKITELRIPTRE